MIFLRVPTEDHGTVVRDSGAALCVEPRCNNRQPDRETGTSGGPLKHAGGVLLRFKHPVLGMMRTGWEGPFPRSAIVESFPASVPGCLPVRSSSECEKHPGGTPSFRQSGRYSSSAARCTSTRSGAAVVTCGVCSRWCNRRDQYGTPSRSSCTNSMTSRTVICRSPF